MNFNFLFLGLLLVGLTAATSFTVNSSETTNGNWTLNFGDCWFDNATNNSVCFNMTTVSLNVAFGQTLSERGINCSSVGALETYNLSYGQTALSRNVSCLTPALLNYTIQFAWPSYGVPSLLSHNCSSGERVLNAVAINQSANLTNNQSWTNAAQNISIYCSAATITQNCTNTTNTVYVNQSVEKIVCPSLNVTKELKGGQHYLDYNTRLDISCAEYAKANSIVMLKDGEQWNSTDLNLLVGCGVLNASNNVVPTPLGAAQNTSTNGTGVCNNTCAYGRSTGPDGVWPYCSCVIPQQQTPPVQTASSNDDGVYYAAALLIIIAACVVAFVLKRRSAGVEGEQE